jgi:hypothetical protein
MHIYTIYPLQSGTKVQTSASDWLPGDDNFIEHILLHKIAVEEKRCVSPIPVASIKMLCPE